MQNFIAISSVFFKWSNHRQTNMNHLIFITVRINKLNNNQAETRNVILTFWIQRERVPLHRVSRWNVLYPVTVSAWNGECLLFGHAYHWMQARVRARACWCVASIAHFYLFNAVKCIHYVTVFGRLIFRTSLLFGMT